tara:strand:- start:251 stop:493 length:243 start_codon:yes stop_codon:yes gene_type:complete
MNRDEILFHAVKIGTECEVETWLELKKLMLVSLPSSSRSLFSVRHPKTKKQGFNEFEQWLSHNYEQAAGVKLSGVPRESS